MICIIVRLLKYGQHRCDVVDIPYTGIPYAKSLLVCSDTDTKRSFTT